MLFLSRDKGLKLTHTQVRKYVHRTNSGNVTEIVPGRRVQFQALAQPMPCSIFPQRDKEALRWGAEGILNSALAAKQADMEEEEVINWLLHHDSYGVQFVAIDGDSGVPLAAEDVVLEKAGEKGWRCTVCDQYIQDDRGKKAHLESRKHKYNATKLEESISAGLENTV
jgi:hypothetical protein